jgi:hypothetical protein
MWLIKTESISSTPATSGRYLPRTNHHADVYHLRLSSCLCTSHGDARGLSCSVPCCSCSACGLRLSLTVVCQHGCSFLVQSGGRVPRRGYVIVLGLGTWFFPDLGNCG